MSINLLQMTWCDLETPQASTNAPHQHRPTVQISLCPACSPKRAKDLKSPIACGSRCQPHLEHSSRITWPSAHVTCGVWQKSLEPRQLRSPGACRWWLVHTKELNTSQQVQRFLAPENSKNTSPERMLRFSQRNCVAVRERKKLLQHLLLLRSRGHGARSY